MTPCMARRGLISFYHGTEITVLCMESVVVCCTSSSNMTVIASRLAHLGSWKAMCTILSSDLLLHVTLLHPNSCLLAFLLTKVCIFYFFSIVHVFTTLTQPTHLRLLFGALFKLKPTSPD